MSQDTKVINFYEWEIQSKKTLKITKAKAKHLIGKLVTILYLIILVTSQTFHVSFQMHSISRGSEAWGLWTSGTCHVCLSHVEEGTQCLSLKIRSVAGEGPEMDMHRYSDIQEVYKLTRSAYWFAWNAASLGFKFSPNVTKHIKTCDGAFYSKDPSDWRDPVLITNA